MPKYIDADKFLLDNDYFADRDFINPRYSTTLRDLVDAAPAADVEPKRKTGRWVGMREYCQHLFDTTGERYTMSQLGISLPHCNQCWEENESRKPFCPNCGAKMMSDDEIADGIGQTFSPD